MKSEREGQGGRGGGTPGPDRPRNEDDLTLSEMGSDWEGLNREVIYILLEAFGLPG